MSTKHNWRLLRTKADETTDDTDWVGTNTAPADAICARLSPYSGPHPSTGIEVIVLAVDAARAVQNRSTGVVTMDLIEVADRAEGDAPAMTDYGAQADVPLGKKVYFPLCGSGRFTVRVTADANLPVGTTDLQIWYREVRR